VQVRGCYTVRASYSVRDSNTIHDSYVCAWDVVRVCVTLGVVS